MSHPTILETARLAPKLINEWTQFDTPPLKSALLLVITTDALRTALVPFMKHKQRIGTPSVIASMSMIVRDVQGADDAERVKRLIAYAHLNMGIRYVLLAGDAREGAIPVRHSYIEQPPAANLDIRQSYNITDHYYSNLYESPNSGVFNTWDASQPGTGLYNHQRWGSSPWTFNPDRVDGYPQVAVGRVPAGAPAELAAFVAKVIAYETRERSDGLSYAYAASGSHPGSDAMADAVSAPVASFKSARVAVAFGQSAPLRTGWPRGTQRDLIAASREHRWLFLFAHGTPQMIEDLASASDARSMDFGGANLPIVGVAACDTGQFASNLPWHDGVSAPYRDRKGVRHEFLKTETSVPTIRDIAQNVEVAKPADLPAPAPYDFNTPIAGRSMASAFLFAASPDGTARGAIAYIGETITMQNDRSTELLTYLAGKALGDGYQRLGDAWISAQRAYWSKHHASHVGGDSNFAHPRVFLSSCTLFGDPSLRLARSVWFAPLRGAALDVAVSADGTSWVIGSNPVGTGGDFGVHKFTNGQWQTVTGGGVRIAAAPDGKPWIVNAKREIFRYVGPGWERIGGAARDIAVGARGAVWVIGTNAVGGGDYGVHEFRGSGWASIDGGGVRIAVDPQGNPWIVNALGEIYRRRDGAWLKLPGLASDIGLGADGTAWIIGTNRVGEHNDYGVFVWTGTSWKPVDGGGVQIAVGPNGTPWVVNSKNEIFYLECA
jgi:Peptidase family C25/Tectonin domain